MGQRAMIVDDILTNMEASMFRPVLMAIIAIVGVHPIHAAVISGNETTPLRWVVRMAASEMPRSEERIVRRNGKAHWDYTAGLFTLSLLKLGEVTGDPRYADYTARTLGSLITSDGRIQGYRADEYNIDHINPGKTVLGLWQLTREERYRIAALTLRRQLDTHPRTSEGGFWHKQRYPHQMWLDGLYMASPFYAQCAVLFQEPATSFDDVVRQIRLVGRHTWDEPTGLFRHGWDEKRQQDWADKDTGRSACCWGRAVGWYAMSMVDVLEFLPADHAGRAEVTAQLDRLCAGMVRHQDSATGLWWQVVDQGGRDGNYLEATVATMMAYTMAKGIHRGWLPRTHEPALKKAWQGILAHFIRQDDGPERISLVRCCSVAGLGYGRDGSYAYYLKEPIVDNDLKGVGPFILAGIEMQRLLGLPMEW